MLRGAAKMSFEVAAKIRCAGVAQGGSHLFVGQALGQKRRRETHSLAHDPCLGIRVELPAEMPLQRADTQSDIHRQSVDAKSGLTDNNPKFVRF